MLQNLQIFTEYGHKIKFSEINKKNSQLMFMKFISVNKIMKIVLDPSYQFDVFK